MSDIGERTVNIIVRADLDGTTLLQVISLLSI